MKKKTHHSLLGSLILLGVAFYAPVSTALDGKVGVVTELVPVKAEPAKAEQAVAVKPVPTVVTPSPEERKVREQKLRRHLAALVKKVKSGELKGASKISQMTNQERVSDLPTLLQNVRGMLSSPLAKQVRVFARTGDRYTPRARFTVAYDPPAKQSWWQRLMVPKENAGFKITQGKSAMQFDPTVGESLVAFLTDPKWFDRAFDIREIKPNPKRDPAVVARKFVLIPKITLPNVKRVVVSVDKDKRPLTVEVLNTQVKKHLVYDFSNAVPFTPKPRAKPPVAAPPVAVPQQGAQKG